VTATVLDGKLARDEIFADLRVRVAALRERGVVPGLGTVIVGDDPGSHAYVLGKHSDCATVGIVSIRRDPTTEALRTPAQHIDTLAAGQRSAAPGLLLANGPFCEARP